MEWLKDLSDRFILWFLQTSSGFEKELTSEGRIEQEMWREQRLRNLKGLALRAQQRAGRKEESH
ncbi:MAG: hypothetical protein GEU77_10860 [Deltaproteobacteria bacterium]|nr:hypothetical protein [Deltaproteobacteria bacterium]